MIDNLSVAPVHEPERQYYFMDLCKSIVLNKEKYPMIDTFFFTDSLYTSLLPV